MNYKIVTVTYNDIVQDSSWDGPEKVKCPTIVSIGWLVDSGDPVKLAGTLDEDKNPCAILAIPRGVVLSIDEHPENVS